MENRVIKKGIDTATASAWYTYLKENVEWHEGVKTRYGTFTRLAYAVDPDKHPEINQFVLKTVSGLFPDKRVAIYGVYLNFYLDGDMYTPSHKHPDTWQMVISLGATRTFTLGSKKIASENGDILLFGPMMHGIPKDSSVKEGRISIACFMRFL